MVEEIRGTRKERELELLILIPKIAVNISKRYDISIDEASFFLIQFLSSTYPKLIDISNELRENKTV